MNLELFEEDELFEGEELLEHGVKLEHFTAEKFEVTEDSEITEIYGVPEKDASAWFEGKNLCSDTLICQAYAGKLLCNIELSEEELCHLAYEHGYYSPEFGCTLYDSGYYLESLDLNVERESGFNIDRICEALENDEKVLCAVSKIAMKFPYMRDVFGLWADSMVQVIGIDLTDENNKRVIINSPSESESAVEIPLDVFENAWLKSECFAVIAGVKRGSAQ